MTSPARRTRARTAKSRTGASQPARATGKQQPKPQHSAERAATAPAGATPAPRRAQKSAARREAILAAALDEFSARGFAATRLDDVAKRAGVAKGTIYLYFADKETLFQELIRGTLGPLINALEHAQPGDVPLRQRLQAIFQLFVREIYATRRGDVARLVISEGHRFPQVAEFYYREVVERAIAAMRRIIDASVAKDDPAHDALMQFPQLVIAPALMAVVWRGLFGRLAPLDVESLLAAHVDLILGKVRT
jgi:AcrR family transcriptional regulator